MVHAALSGASPAALKKLETLRKRREHRETWPVEKQVVRLPASSGAPPAIELEDADDFLQVVLDHRRAPPNDKNPGCLSQDGFGSYSTDPVAKEHRSNRRKRGSKRGSKWQTRSNPALQTTPAAEDKLPQIESEVRSAPLSLPHSASAPAGSGGVFFQTEVELEEGNAQKLGKPTMLKTSSLPSVASLPSLTEKGKEGRLEELSEMSTEWKPYPSESVSLVEPSEELQKITAPSPQCAERAGDKDQKKIQAQRLMRAFHKAVDGRSVLILTDQSDVRKSIMRSLMCAINEMSICFTCSTADLWKRLQGKEVFHALLVDLSKADLEVEGLVKTIRADPQYGNLPIIVLSQERELPDLVRQSCSFVVFQPLSASMLREALLWCFNRSALKHQSYYWPAPAVAPLKRSGNISKAPNLTVRARQLKNR